MDRGPMNSSDILLQSIVRNQADLAKKIDETISKMVTKHDMERVFNQFSNYMPRTEIELYFVGVKEHLEKNEAAIKAEADKINGLLANRLPKWFWPAVSGTFALLGPIMTLYVEHAMAVKH
jgi:hypothetical protein